MLLFNVLCMYNKTCHYINANIVFCCFVYNICDQSDNESNITIIESIHCFISHSKAVYTVKPSCILLFITVPSWIIL